MRLITIHIILIILIVHWSASAQEAFQPKISLINSENYQNLVLTADFNNDAAQDILIFQSGEEECCIGDYRILINDGSGNFSQEIDVATNTSEWENVLVSDIDDDGDADIIILQAESSAISWYRNEGTSGFSAVAPLISDYTGEAFELADFTGDGLADFIYSSFNTDAQLFLIANQGELNFAEPTLITEGELIHIGDFDQDGQNDLFTTNGVNNQVVWQRNTGNGVFSPDTTNIISETTFFIPDILIGDFDGDDTNELVISYALDGEDGIITPKLYSFVNDEFMLKGSLIELEEFDLSPQNTRANDIDQDGDLDILASFTFALAFARTESDFDQYVGWYENTGNFQFTPRLLNGALLTGSYVDLNNDQQLDIILKTPNELVWQENLGQATFAAPKYLTDSRAVPIPFSDESGTFVNFGDLNQDGFPEVIVTEGTSNRVLRFANQDSTLATPPDLLTLNTLIPGDAAILKTPERTDLLLIGGAAIEGKGIFRYAVQENATLGKKDTLYSGTLDAIYTGDFNGDSFPDVAFSDRSLSVDGEVFVLTGQPDGAYEVVDTQIIGVLEEVYDLNRDGITDLIIDGSIYTRSSAGSFVVLQAPDFPFDQILDINGDSLADFLLFSEAEVTLFLANNDGSYQEQTITFGSNYDFTLIPWLFLDIDNDLDQDLVVVNNTGDEQELAYLKNQNGSTMFGEYTVIEKFASQDVLLFKHDIDQDTDTDLVVLTDTELAWYRSNAVKGETSEPAENIPPIVAQSIEDQQSAVGSTFSFVIPTDAFQDDNEGDTLTLTVTLADDTALPDWLTFDPSANTLSGNPPEAGELTIKITAADTSAASVSDEFVLTIIADKTVTSLDDNLADGIRLYPVPASQALFLESEATTERLIAYRLLDTQGKIIQNQPLSDQRSARIDVASLPRGFYLLEIQTSNRVLQRRLLIE
ncbi:MAG: FG-GAP-like repeat-containing protein [Tunicatimonas sp.]|uniref:FG-GAP-like repeat-containing protein n=1 Tax=Tunicatimonas sp. TaxID=1940096 RepID=UPI003C716813